MRENILRKFLGLDDKNAGISMRKSIIINHNTRSIIPEKYFIDVITTIPERKPVVENYDFL